MKRVLIALLCTGAMLAGCDTLNLRRSVSSDTLAKVHRVGVVSLMGDDFHGVTLGLTIFGNSSFLGEVPDWQVDHEANNRALADLSRNASFTAAALDVGNTSIKALTADDGRAIYDLAATQGFDTLVVIEPGVSSNYPYLPPGIGVFSSSVPLMTPRPMPYVGFTVVVINVAERKEKAWEWGGAAPFSFEGGSVPMHESFGQFTSEEKSQLRERILTNLGRGIDYALEKLSLVPGYSSR